MKRMLLSKYFGLFCLAVIIFTQNTCKSPIGLGSHMDVTAPVIETADYGPKPGDYLTGTQRIYIKAIDDKNLSSVTATYWYNLYEDGAGVSRTVKEGPSVTVDTKWDADKGCYYFDVDTLRAISRPDGTYEPMADGAFKVVISATDSSGKTTTSTELFYTVKNNPPTLDMLIPKPIKLGDPALGPVDLVTTPPYPEVVTGSYLMGIFEDLAGVAPGYPWIKFWKVGDPEPTEYWQNTGWESVAPSTDRDCGDGWVRADEGFSENGERGGSFRFYLRHRTPEGAPSADSKEGESPALAVGPYYVKIKAIDRLERDVDPELVPDVEWPGNAYGNKPDAMIVELITTGTPPEVEWDPSILGKMYFREDFLLKAKAEKTGDAASSIEEMKFTVTGKNKAGVKTEVLLKSWTREYTDSTSYPTMTLEWGIELGKTYYNRLPGETPVHVVDSEEDLPSDYYSYITFNDGNFNFYAYALDDQGAHRTISLSPYVDRQPPKTQITRVSPSYSEDDITLTAVEDAPNTGLHGAIDAYGNPIPDPYRRWTVNSTISIDANYTDNRGAGIDDETGYEKFKYLVLKNTDITESDFTTWQNGDSTKTFGDYLYQRSDAEFLERVKANPKSVPPGVADNGNPMSKVTGSDGSYVLTWQTHKYDAAAAAIPYKIWAYVVAMDSAGTTSYQKILLNIDQETDKPVITFGNINNDGTTFMSDKYRIQLKITDDDGLTTGSVQYRFAKDDDQRALYESDPEEGWKNLAVVLGQELSQSGLTIDINDFSLLKIACDYLGDHNGPHEMDDKHKLALGDEKAAKYIQVRAADNGATPPKLYGTDGTIRNESDLRSFNIDLRSPQVTASETDLLDRPIVRSIPAIDDPDAVDNPFGAPEKDGAYNELPFVYGDIIEQNLKSILVKIDGREDLTITYPVARIYDYTETPPADGFAVWKTMPEVDWEGELRWRIPMSDFHFGAMIDGPHTFEITFEDKVPQLITKQLTFFKDTKGPAIGLIIPGGERVYLSNDEFTLIKNGNIPGEGTALREKYETLMANSIRDAAGKLAAAFVDDFSPVAEYTYTIDNETPVTVSLADAAAKSKSVSWEIKLADKDGNRLIPDGFHRLSLSVKDASGNSSPPEEYHNLVFLVDTGTPKVTITDPANQSTLTGSSIAITGTIEDTLFVQRLDVYLDGTEYAFYLRDRTASYTAGVWVYDEAADKFVNGSPTTIEVMANGGFTVLLDGIDEGARSVSVTATGSSGTIGNGMVMFTYDKQGPSISLSPPLTAYIYGEINGAGNVVEVNTSQLASNSIKDTAIVLSGTFNDNFSAIYNNPGNVTFWYKVDGKTANYNNTVGKGWIQENFVISQAPGSKSLVWTIKLPSDITSSDPGEQTEDGEYLLSIRVKDSLGNGYAPVPDVMPNTYKDDPQLLDDIANGSNANSGPGYLSDLIFTIERGVPILTLYDTLKETDPEYSTLYYPWSSFQSGSVILKGKITGVGSIARLSVKQDQDELAAAGGELGAVGNYVNVPSLISDSTNKIHTFEINIPASSFEAGSYSLMIAAKGPTGQSAMAVRNFTYDITSPPVDFSTPAKGENVTISGGYSFKTPVGEYVTWSNGRYKVMDSGTWVNGDPKISGTAEDTNGVAKISYHLGKLGDTDANRDDLFNNPANWDPTGLGTGSTTGHWSGGLYYWTFQDPNLNVFVNQLGMIDKVIVPGNPSLNTFYLPLYVKVEDLAGNATVVQYRIWVDPDKDIPSAVINSPNNNASVGGEVRIQGNGIDDDMVALVQIRIRPEIQDLIKDANMTANARWWGGYYKDDADNWAYPGSAIPDEIGWINTTIQGANDTTVSWNYNSNKDGLLSPVTDQSRMVTIQVRAIDTKNFVDKTPDLAGGPVTWILYFDAGVPMISTPVIEKTGLDSVTYADGIRVSGVFDMTTTVRDEGGISSIRARASNGSGFVEIVKDGLEVGNGGSLGGTSGTTWAITKKPTAQAITAADAGYRFMLTDVGSGNDWSLIDLDFAGGGKTYVAGVWIRLMRNPSIASPISGFKANGGNQAASDNDTANWDTQFFEYGLKFTVNTIANPTLTYGRTGNYTLDLQVYDNNQVPAPYNTNGTYSPAIDNFYPDAVITTQYNAATANFYVMGSAKDFGGNSGAIQGLERMLVYFSRTTTGANPVTTYYNAAGTDVTAGMRPRPDVKDVTKDIAAGGQLYTGDNPNVASFTYFPVLANNTVDTVTAWRSDHAMVIDTQELAAASDTDKDGTKAEMWQRRGAEMDWQALLDTTVLTTKIGDGPLMVHYVIMDQAGNATHYQYDIYIGNNKPLIRTITLGTDLNGNGDVGDAGENGAPITVGTTVDGNREITTNFRVRNNRFGLKLDTLYGNNQKHYSVSYVTRGSSIQSTTMARGKVYTINDPGNTEWTRYGALNNNAGTTFVASGKARDTNDSGAATTGTVYSYSDGVAATQRTGTFTSLNGGENADIVDDILFYNGTVNGVALNHFGTVDQGRIPDSTVPTPGTYPDPANPPLQHDRYFIIKVYDHTVTGGAESEQLAHVALINVDISNADTIAPVIEFAPFGQEYLLRDALTSDDYPLMAKNSDRVVKPVAGYTRNIVTTSVDSNGIGTGTKKGYVQYEDDDTAAAKRANLSGMVIFKGKAADNGRISKITATIPGYKNSAEFDIAAWNTANNTLMSAVPATNTIAAMRSNDGIEWGFEADNNSLTLDYNHVVNWNFAWDTSTVTGVAQNNVSITFRVYDARDLAGNYTLTAGETKATTVNIVPYITEIITPLTSANSANPSAFNRAAANGWYPVREDDYIHIRGFNLTGAAISVTNANANNTAASLNSVVAGAAGATVGGITVPAGVRASTYLTARVDSDGNAGNTTNAILSGALVARVNNVDSLNNRNNNTAAYNQEPNGLNNNRLTDDRGLYVWNTGRLVISNNIGSPVMRMDNNANRYISFSSYIAYATSNTVNAHLKLVKNNDQLANLAPVGSTAANTTVANNVYTTTAPGVVIYQGNRYLNGTLGVSPTGEWAVASSNQTSPQGNFSFVYNNWNQGAGWSRSDQAAQANQVRRFLLALGDNPNRIRFPRIAMRRTDAETAPGAASPERVVLAYYDSAANGVYPITLNYGFFHGTTYMSGTFTGNNATDVNTQFPNQAQYVATGGDTYTEGGTTYITKAKSSQYVATGLLSNGRAVVAWYDATNQCLWFSYGNALPTSSGNGNNTTWAVPSQTMKQWQDNAVNIKDYAGTHVDMVVDGANGVHLAYVDARNGGLWYTYIANATSPGTNTTVRVDTYLSAGTKLMLNVREQGTGNYVPYITYIHNAFAETKNSVRVAWRNTTTTANVLHGTNEDHTFTGDWEVMTMPAENVPLTDEFVSNGVPTGTSDWTAPTAAYSTLRTHTATVGGTAGQNILRRSILVGYRTANHYEGAVLKHVLW